MGEVWAKVRLTNAADVALVRRQMMRPADVRSWEVSALIDIGATSLVLPSLVVERWRFARPFTHVAAYAAGRREEVDVTEVRPSLQQRHVERL